MCRHLNSERMFWGPKEHGVRQNARHGWTSCRILKSFLERHFLLSNLGPQLWVWLWPPLSNTKTRGYKTYLPQKGAELYFIKTSTLLTLLNTVYKIAAKAIANRIRLVLPNLINHDQTGFLKDRFIGENIRTHRLYQPIRHGKEHPGLVTFYWL